MRVAWFRAAKRWKSCSLAAARFDLFWFQERLGIVFPVQEAGFIDLVLKVFLYVFPNVVGDWGMEHSAPAGVTCLGKGGVLAG